jgi:hypothetical protein
MTSPSIVGHNQKPSTALQIFGQTYGCNRMHLPSWFLFVAGKLGINGYQSQKKNSACLLKKRIQNMILKKLYSSYMLTQAVSFAGRQYNLGDFEMAGSFATEALRLRAPCAKKLFKRVQNDCLNALLECESPLTQTQVMMVCQNFSSKRMKNLIALAQLLGNPVPAGTPSYAEILNKKSLEPSCVISCLAHGLHDTWQFDINRVKRGLELLQSCTNVTNLVMRQGIMNLYVKRSLHCSAGLGRAECEKILRELIAQGFEPAKFCYVSNFLEGASGCENIANAIFEFDKHFPDGHPRFPRLGLILRNRLSDTNARMWREVYHIQGKEMKADIEATKAQQMFQEKPSKNNQKKVELILEKCQKLRDRAALAAQKAEAHSRHVVGVLASLKEAKKKAKAAAKKLAKEEATAEKRAREEAGQAGKPAKK